jgi:uncharacterized membrane protein
MKALSFESSNIRPRCLELRSGNQNVPTVRGHFLAASIYLLGALQALHLILPRSRLGGFVHLCLDKWAGAKES